ncbi:MAG TPA: 50S ribosomal protein L29 [Nitrosopumilaceae archaeon]|nr:50S ribosomal protein L29 [Nitrosopumilaceae archaeon]
MARIKMKTVRAFNEKDLKDRLQQARSELAKLKIDAAKGTLRKESGKMKPLKRDIARMLTRLNEMKKQ